MPFLFGNFDANKNLVKNIQFRYGMSRKLLSPPLSSRRQHFRGNFFRCPFQYPKVPLVSGAPPPLTQSFDASYAPVNTDLLLCADNTYVHYHHCSSNMPSNPVSSPSNSNNRSSPLSSSGKSFSSVFRSGE